MNKEKKKGGRRIKQKEVETKNKVWEKRLSKLPLMMIRVAPDLIPLLWDMCSHIIIFVFSAK